MTVGGYGDLVATSPRPKPSTTARAAALHHVVEKSSAPRQNTAAVHVRAPQKRSLTDIEPLSKAPFVQEVRTSKAPHTPEVRRAQKTAFTPSVPKVPHLGGITKALRDSLAAMSWDRPTAALHHSVALSPPRPHPTPADAQPLTAAERDFLREHSGVPRSAAAEGPGEPEPLWVAVLGTHEAAERLHVSDTTINRRAHTNRLLAYPVRGRLLFPRWQFTSDGDTVAGLEVALSPLPSGWGPYRVQQFFTTPDEHLDDLTPIEWLRRGHGGSRVAQVLEGEARA